MTSSLPPNGKAEQETICIIVYKAMTFLKVGYPGEQITVKPGNTPQLVPAWVRDTDTFRHAVQDGRALVEIKTPQPDKSATRPGAQSDPAALSAKIDRQVPNARNAASRTDGDTGSNEKGNMAILRGTDGKLKHSVTLEVASRFGGVTKRSIERAAKKRALKSEGNRTNRRITVKSLLEYFPPEDNAT